MMIKLSATTVLACGFVGCASVSQQYNLDFKTLSARLYVIDSSGAPIRPFNGELLEVHGVEFTSDAISLPPGKQRIGYLCPTPPGGLEMTDYMPSVQFDFEIGKSYELRCENGAPVVRSRLP